MLGALYRVRHPVLLLWAIKQRFSGFAMLTVAIIMDLKKTAKAANSNNPLEYDIMEIGLKISLCLSMPTQ
jgi:hypothetical protein